MHHDGPDGVVSGFVCPRCGGALWERRDGDALKFECRIGDALSAAELWIEHCAARNRALKEAARALAENAALARKLATWTGERGNLVAAAALEEQAAEGDRLHGQVRAMLEGLPEADPDVAR
jgi:two-component system, chemotaxis family, protein-glutamate methylesterase/glutaminase